MNKFHFIVFLTWQFGIFFAVQQIFPIFMKYKPKWKCVEPKDDGDNSTLLYPAIFSDNCTIYRSCPKAHLVFDQVAFYSTAMEFDWICSSKKI